MEINYGDKVKIIKKDRSYKTGFGGGIVIKDCARIMLNSNEQVTFQSKNFLYDFCKKNWGYYSTPSINKRLKNNGFEVYLIQNLTGDIYLWSVEKNKKKNFLNYLKKENQKIIAQLDNINSPKEIIKNIKKNYEIQCKCPSSKKIKNNTTLLYSYTGAPKDEPDYGIQAYKRKILKCNVCNHCRAEHDIDTKKFYSKNYSVISHGKNIEEKFKKILNLKKKSDNYFRVKRFLKFFKNSINVKIKLLDIGSGLSVFLYTLSKKVKWDIRGIEPDLNFVNFAKKKLKLNVTKSTLEKNKNKSQYNIISLNKVIEHVKNPILFLKKTNRILKNNGYVYIEVPDGESASQAKDAKNREEFYVDHLHAFSLKSLANCLKRANFKLLKIDRILEPSGKLTIYAFAKKI
jgi:2-polyprenyl-3-methyl-5-hydroxy-6-metoxy-1,4-benzoquinol methylase